MGAGRRAVTLLIASLVAAAALVSVQLATTAPAAAAQANLARYVSDFEPANTDTTKSAVAYCPAGHQILSGGATIYDTGQNRVMLTSLVPATNESRDAYWATAQAQPGFAGSWSMDAYAICGTGLTGHEVIEGGIVVGSEPFVATLARCPAGKLATGTGSHISNGNRRVGLQLNRPSGPRDISRTTAREFGAFTDQWLLASYVICADPTALTVEGELDADTGDVYQCTGSGLVHNVSGGAGLADSGPVFLRTLFPSEDLRVVAVAMTGTPTSGIAVQAMCG